MTKETKIPIKCRCDGANDSAYGRRFCMLPDFAVGLPPSRIDVYVPGAIKLAPQISEVPEDDKELQISQTLQRGAQNYPNRKEASNCIIRSLEHWCEGFSDFKSTYLSLPYGSRIVVENASSSIERTVIHFVPTYTLEKQWVSPKNLRARWEVSQEVILANWPETIDIGELRLHSQPHDAISLVTIPKHHQTKLFVFKSPIEHVEFLYQELKLLLSMKPHPNILPPPLFLVTAKCLFGGKVGVCGIIEEYYDIGSLRDLFNSKVHESLCNGITTRDQVTWSQEIISALEFINKSPVGYYPDMKADNVILKHGSNGKLKTLLIDFEQRGAHYYHSPPEIYYINYFEQLVTAPSSPKWMVDKYSRLLEEYIPTWRPEALITVRPSDAKDGNSAAWNFMSQREREAAQVFMYGKLLWCLFEKASTVNGRLGFGITEQESNSLVFPEFQQTPMEVRDLIRSCTTGAMEWEGRNWMATVGGKAQPGDASAANSYENHVDEETEAEREAIKVWWSEEIQKAESFLVEKIRLRKLEVEFPAIPFPSSEDRIAAAGAATLYHAAHRPRFSEITTELRKIAGIYQ
ncbi:hypothetical protein H072_9848 [Dactylellina haptotyla CBS 200.50]|uniref:Protein kinase domain-containing protein n=1 Tax=Dactylellina haptotyla (strain CBS 200.50) TaxID=1284197 RepID=S8A1K5_DACHA|nr:hypothetical protein H072_9848 [Dactylellina haptotyla CBS 200.50]